MVITLKNIQKKFAGNLVFDDLSLTIMQGKLTVIHGKSGSGKTTLLNIIGLIDTFDRGEYLLFGKVSPSQLSKEALVLRREKISYLFQNYALIEDLTIGENLDVGLFYKKLSKKEKIRAKNNALEQVGLRYPLKKKIYQLSGGEKQRVALARVLLKESSIILADEPTGSLDEENRNEIFSLLKQEVLKGKTVIMVSHDPYIIEGADIRVDIEKL